MKPTLTWNQKKALRSAHHHLKQARVMLMRFADSVGMQSTLADTMRWEGELADVLAEVDGNREEARQSGFADPVALRLVN